MSYLRMKKVIDKHEVVEIFKGEKISIYEIDDCNYDEENPCIQYVVDEDTSEVLYRLQSDRAISVQAVE